MVTEDDLLDIHESRSEMAQAVDEALDAELTYNEEQWAAAPDEFDYPGIDTPSAETDRVIMDFNEGNIGLKELGDRLTD